MHACGRAIGQPLDFQHASQDPQEESSAAASLAASAKLAQLMQLLRLNRASTCMLHGADSRSDVENKQSSSPSRIPACLQDSSCQAGAVCVFLRLTQTQSLICFLDPDPTLKCYLRFVCRKQREIPVLATSSSLAVLVIVASNSTHIALPL